MTKFHVLPFRQDMPAISVKKPKQILQICLPSHVFMVVPIMGNVSITEEI